MSTINRNIMKFTPNEELFGYETDNQMLVWMKPSEFLDKALRMPPDNKFSANRQDFIDKLSNKMKKDEPIDPLFLDIDITNCKVTNHEGRHRAIAAGQLGIARVPVVIYLKNGDGDFVSVKEYLKQVTTAKAIIKCNLFDAKKQE